jgi:hypothetical protein
MLPPLAASAFGAVLAGRFAPAAGLAHLAAMFFAVYTAHVKDGYVDFHRRGEDEEHPLTVDGCELALWAATGLHLAALAGLWVVAGAGAVAVTAPTWLIAYHHAPQLDTNPVGATAGYPAGIGLCVLGGYVVQTGTVAAEPAG